MSPAELEEEISFLRRNRKKAYLVYCADQPDEDTAFIETLLLPGQTLFFAYHSRKHERDAAPLLRRCAKALGYVVSGDPPEFEE